MPTIIATSSVWIFSRGRSFLEFSKAYCGRRSLFAFLARPCWGFLLSETIVATSTSQMTLSTWSFQKFCELSSFASRITTHALQEATDRSLRIPACIATSITKMCLGRRSLQESCEGSLVTLFSASFAMIEAYRRTPTLIATSIAQM